MARLKLVYLFLRGGWLLKAKNVCNNCQYCGGMQKKEA